MTTEDAPATTLAAEVRRAIADVCRAYVGRCAEAVAMRAQTREEWRRVVDDCDREASRYGFPWLTLRATAVAARLMAEGDADTAARELAAVHGRSVAEWRAIQRNDRDGAA